MKKLYFILRALYILGLLKINKVYVFFCYFCAEKLSTINHRLAFFWAKKAFKVDLHKNTYLTYVRQNVKSKVISGATFSPSDNRNILYPPDYSVIPPNQFLNLRKNSKNLKYADENSSELFKNKN